MRSAAGACWSSSRTTWSFPARAAVRIARPRRVARRCHLPAVPEVLLQDFLHLYLSEAQSLITRAFHPNPIQRRCRATAGSRPRIRLFGPTCPCTTRNREPLFGTFVLHRAVIAITECHFCQLAQRECPHSITSPTDFLSAIGPTSAVIHSKILSGMRTLGVTAWNYAAPVGCRRNGKPAVRSSSGLCGRPLPKKSHTLPGALEQTS